MSISNCLIFQLSLAKIASKIPDISEYIISAYIFLYSHFYTNQYFLAIYLALYLLIKPFKFSLSLNIYFFSITL